MNSAHSSHCQPCLGNAPDFSSVSASSTAPARTSLAVVDSCVDALMADRRMFSRDICQPTVCPRSGDHQLARGTPQQATRTLNSSSAVAYAAAWEANLREELRAALISCSAFST